MYDLVNIYDKKQQKLLLLWRIKMTPNVGRKLLLRMLYHKIPKSQAVKQKIDDIEREEPVYGTQSATFAYETGTYAS